MAQMRRQVTRARAVAAREVATEVICFSKKRVAHPFLAASAWVLFFERARLLCWFEVRTVSDHAACFLFSSSALGCRRFWTRACCALWSRPPSTPQAAPSHRRHNRNLGRNADVGRILLDSQKKPPTSAVVHQPACRALFYESSGLERVLVCRCGCTVVIVSFP